MFTENDEGDDDDDYNRTLRDVSLMEDFTLDDDTPTTLPKDPFPPVSGQSTLNDASTNTYKPESSIFVATLQSVLGDDEKLVPCHHTAVLEKVGPLYEEVATGGRYLGGL